MEHDLRHAEELLRRAGRARVAEGVEREAEGVLHRERLAARGELAFVGAEHEETLSAARAGGARTEGAGVRRDVGDAVRRHHGARREGEVDAALDLPSGDVHGERRGVADADVFLLLIAARRVGFDADDGEEDIRRLAEWDAGVVGGADADGPAGVGDAVGDVEMLSARADELVEQVADAVVEGLARGPIGEAPFGAIQVGFHRNEVGHVLDVVLDDQRFRRSAGRLNHLVHDRTHAA